MYSVGMIIRDYVYRKKKVYTKWNHGAGMCAKVTKTGTQTNNI